MVARIDQRKRIENPKGAAGNENNRVLGKPKNKNGQREWYFFVNKQ